MESGQVLQGNETKLDEDPFFFFKPLQFTVLGTLFAVTLLGNGGVLYSILYGRSRKSRMNYFITHLAITDLSVGLICIPVDIVWKITVVWYAGNVACKLLRFLEATVTYASTYVLVALSIDRYDAIRHPMNFSGSWKRAKFLIIAAWLFSLLFSTPLLIFYEEKSINNTLQCWIDFDRQWQWQVYVTLVSVTVFIIPALIIATCYTIIIATIWSKNSKNFAKIRTGSDTRRMSSRGLIPRAKVKTIKITFVIISVFIFCWSPYIVFNMLQVYGHVSVSSKVEKAIATLFQSLATLNSAANPIIYCLFSTHFCKTLRSLPPMKWFLRSKKRKPRDSTINTKSSTFSELITMGKTKIEASPSNSQGGHPVLVH